VDGGTTAQRHFVEASGAEDQCNHELAEHLLRQASDLEPRMPAALTDLGSLVDRQGEIDEARRLHERAVDRDPNEPEARHDLANLLEDVDETELAIGELRGVGAAIPELAAQAGHRLERHLELDPASDRIAHTRGDLDHVTAERRSAHAARARARARRSRRHGKAIRPGAPFAPLWVWQLLQSPIGTAPPIARVPVGVTTLAWIGNASSVWV